MSTRVQRIDASRYRAHAVRPVSGGDAETGSAVAAARFDVRDSSRNARDVRGARDGGDGMLKGDRVVLRPIEQSDLRRL